MSLFKRCKVLVVEDEYFLAHDISEALRTNGADVVGPIGDLNEAIDHVRRDGFDVAVLDINLRNQAVYGVAEQLMQAGIPFVFATGYSAEIIPPRFRQVMRIEKPCDVAQLVAAVSRLCEGVETRA